MSKNKSRHSDGSPCRAKSSETCPFNKVHSAPLKNSADISAALGQKEKEEAAEKPSAFKKFLNIFKSESFYTVNGVEYTSWKEAYAAEIETGHTAREAIRGVDGEPVYVDAQSLYFGN